MHNLLLDSLGTVEHTQKDGQTDGPCSLSNFTNELFLNLFSFSFLLEIKKQKEKHLATEGNKREVSRWCNNEKRNGVIIIA
jgi:hypothetical protein